MNEVIIEKRIYVIRGERVMVDADLAELYGVETKALNQQVRRNLGRFPEDFMFRLTAEEFQNLRSQFVTSSLQHGGRRFQPYVFTENGVAMLSSILTSERAIEVNIAIMRTFVKLRSYLAFDRPQAQFQEDTAHLFRVVFERLDGIEETLRPKVDPQRKKIGLTSKKN